MSGFRFDAARPARVAALISGRGSNMLALADACAAADAPARLALVVSDRPDAPGLAAAAARGIATATAEGPGKPAREAQIAAALERAAIDLVCLAGFLRILSPGFVAARRDRILNVHPSLLPSFRGLDTHARALAGGVRIHGATVHLARAELDDGPILAQAALAVGPDDDAERLSARVLALEHRIYPAALFAYARGALWLEGEQVRGRPALGDAAIVSVADG